MGKFKDFLFEKEAKTETYEDVDMTSVYDNVSEVDVNTDNVSQDNLIADIYNQNDLSDLSKSIFKVEELMNSLPKEMPDATKKATVLSILTSFNVTVDEVIADADNRIEMILSALNRIQTDNEEVINQNSQDIEQKKLEIQDLEKDNADRTLTVKVTQDKVEAERTRIVNLVKFIGGE